MLMTLSMSHSLPYMYNALHVQCFIVHPKTFALCINALNDSLDAFDCHMKHVQSRNQTSSKRSQTYSNKKPSTFK